MLITTLMFDCDNTLVLSEELAFEACADLANQILSSKGLKQRYTGDMLIADFVGQNFRGMMVSLQSKYGFTLSTQEMEYYVKQEEKAVIAKLEAKGEPCLGSMQIMEKLFKDKKYRLAVVSSSAIARVRASIKKVGQDVYFPYEHVYSAASSLPKPTTKPDPAIYLHAMKQMGVKPENVVAVEDSKSGATAAVRAGINTIAYVGAYNGEEKQLEVTELLKTVGCKATMTHWSQFFDKLAEIEAM